MAAACDRLYTVDRLVKELGFSQHPTIARLRSQRLLSAKRGVVLDVLHHADAETLYADLPSLEQQPVLGGAAVEAIQLLGRPAVPEPIGSRLEYFMIRSGIERVRQSLDEHSAVLYSLGPRLGPTQDDFLHPLLQYTNPKPADVDFLAAESPLQTTLSFHAGAFFFRVLHINAERAVLPKSAGRVRSKQTGMRDCCLVIAPLRVQHVSREKVITVSLDGNRGQAGAAFVLDMGCLGSKDLQTLRRWKLDPEAGNLNLSLIPTSKPSSDALEC